MIAPSTRHDVYGLRLWIYISAWCSASGWVLSAFGYLNRTGYAVALLFFVGILIPIHGRGRWWPQTISLRRFNPLFRGSPVPRIWLLFALLSFIGGVIYHPANYDYLTYRFPRVLHWCAEQRWQWISTVDVRINLSAAGFEWADGTLVCFFQDRPSIFPDQFYSLFAFAGSHFFDVSFFRHQSKSMLVVDVGASVWILLYPPSDEHRE